MNDQMKALEEALRADEAKAAAYQEALKKAAQDGAKSDGEAISMAAAAVGFEVSPQDYEDLLAESAELDDDDLALAAGGELEQTSFGPTAYEDEYGHDNWCVTIWHCALVSRHTESVGEGVACFADYKCFIAYHDNMFESGI